MQNTTSPCIWMRLKNTTINPTAVLCAGIFMFSESVVRSLRDNQHQRSSQTKQICNNNRPFYEDHSFPCLKLKTTQKALSSFTVTVKEFTMSFCDRLTSGSKRNTFEKRGFVPVPSELGKNRNVSWFWRFLTQPRSYNMQYLGCWIHTVQ